jgi:hypothetical protein
LREDASAHRQHHGGVLPKQASKGVLITAQEELLHQLTIRPPATVAQQRRPRDALQDWVRLHRDSLES